MQPTINTLADGKFEVTWPVCSARAKDGRIITGRPETVAALAPDAELHSYRTARKVSADRVELERQL